MNLWGHSHRLPSRKNAVKAVTEVSLWWYLVKVRRLMSWDFSSSFRLHASISALDICPKSKHACRHAAHGIMGSWKLRTCWGQESRPGPGSQAAWSHPNTHNKPTAHQPPVVLHTHLLSASISCALLTWPSLAYFVVCVFGLRSKWSRLVGMRYCNLLHMHQTTTPGKIVCFNKTHTTPEAYITYYFAFVAFGDTLRAQRLTL